MRLIDLSAAYLNLPVPGLSKKKASLVGCNGHQALTLGIVFQCPHCVRRASLEGKPPYWLTCMFRPLQEIDPGLFAAVLKRAGVDTRKEMVINCRADLAWSATNADNLERITIMPSIDASAAGHWHGTITNGVCS